MADRVAGMRAWPAVPIPELPGHGVIPTLFDTALGRPEAITGGARLNMYVCGITPYDAAHLGHAATYVAFDTAQRAARDAGVAVTYVQNITDVDDPLLERANATGDDWRALAERETDRFRQDMAALRVLPPDSYLGVVESLPLIISMIECLRDGGQAYQLDGDWYFAVDSDPDFGSVAGMSTEQMLPLFAERGGDPDRPGKKHPLDCLLWSAHRPGEPSWDASLGAGRPGWHVECVAIAQEGLGPVIDLQGGGSDLVFPHHQMCASIAAVLSDEPFAHHYAHTGMVALDGEKMSKSKGNLEFVSRLRAQGAHPGAIRLALLAHHYRNDWEWTAAELVRAQERLQRWRDAANATHRAPALPLLAEVRAALADDLNTPAAIDAIDAWCDLSGRDVSGPQLFAHLVDALLGIDLRGAAAS
jgi:L-cysteine:1D-myo-inositol 2-amino-2-deoxy-alpha-D-glucopyranoside ligase